MRLANQSVFLALIAISAFDRVNGKFKLRFHGLVFLVCGFCVFGLEANDSQTESVIEVKVNKCPPLSTTIHPTIHPAVRESNNNISHAHAHARGDVPTIERVMAATEMMGVPKYYAKWWYVEMEARDWRKTAGSYGPADWELCAERCRH